MARLLRLLPALVLAAAAACGGAGEAPPEPAAAVPVPPADPRQAALQVARALEARDFARLAELVHPGEGVRFSPYAYVDPEEHATLTREDLRRVAAGAALERTWGFYDGTGEPITLPFRQYFERFVYDAPYLSDGRVTVDERQGHGNTIDNAARIYPRARIVEYHLPGRDPRYGGMDWRSLRLALAEEGGRFFLVGVIHDEWTI